MLDLPRSARLALWAPAVLAGDPDALARVCGDDEPHTVSPLGEGVALGESTPLPVAMAWLAGCGATSLRLVLPVPGDLTGLTGPPAVNAAAVAAGEAVLTVGGPTCHALVPEVVEFGSAWEPGATVSWRMAVVPSPPPPEDLAAADRELRRVMLETLDDLHHLDVAQWRPDAAARIERVRGHGLVPREVPQTTSPRAARLLTTAARLRAVVDLAQEDDGASVSGWEAGRRDVALRQVDRAARHAVVAAVNSAASEGGAQPRSALS